MTLLGILGGVGLLAYFVLLGACLHAALTPEEDSAATQAGRCVVRGEIPRQDGVVRHESKTTGRGRGVEQ